MTWTYSGNPNASQLDYVRFLCGDTEADDPLLQDEEIQFLLETDGSVLLAAESACEKILMKFAKEVDYAIGPEKVSASQRYKHFKDLLEHLRAKRRRTNGAPLWKEPYSKTGKAIFDVGMHDNKGGI